MQRILLVFARFTHIGVDARVPRAEVRCITLQNSLALVFSLTALAYIPLILAYLPATRPLLILNAVYAFPLLLVIALNALRQYLLARLFFYLYSVIFVSLSTLWMGIESNMHFFLASGLFFQFFTFPPRQRILMFMVTLANVGAYILLETQLAHNPYLLDVPADFRRYFRLGVMLGLAGFIFAISYYTYIMIRNAEAGLELEQQKSENLLLNILPGRIVDRLKTNPGFLAERFDEATIMFADIVDFTVLSEKMSPPDLVQMLDRIFREFDLLADKLQLEKIKTIGDAYMIAGGVPIARADHTAAVARMALEMQSIMRTELGDLGLRLRVGIHCGPIVAGVIGHRKFIYDLWGDTVNTASRMESHGVIGEIQVTEAVYTRLKDEFDFEARGPIAVKGKGTLPVYVLRGEQNKL